MKKFTFEVQRVTNGYVVVAKNELGVSEVFVTQGDPTPGNLVDAYITAELMNPTKPAAKPAAAQATPQAPSMAQLQNSIVRNAINALHK